MAITQIRSNNQLLDDSVTLVKMSDEFLAGATWNVSTANDAVITGLATPVGVNDAATKGYIDTLIDSSMKSPDGYATVAAGDYPTNYKATGAVAEGDMFYITSVANGTLVGTETVNVGDALVAIVDAPGNVDANWVIMESNRDQATETVKGIAEIATAAEVTAGTNDTDIVTPLKLAGAISAGATTAGAGLTDTAGTYDVVAADASLLVAADDVAVQVGTTNGTSLETTATGVELAATVTGNRSFTQGAGEIFAISNTDVNGALLSVSPDGTLPVAIANVAYVDSAITANALTASDGVLLTGSNLTLGGGLTQNRGVSVETFDLALNSNALGGSVSLGTAGAELGSLNSRSINSTLHTLNDHNMTAGNDINLTAGNDVAINATSILTLQSAGTAVVASQANSPLILSTTGINEAQLTQQPDGIVPLAISTTGYVDAALAAGTITASNGLTKTGNDIALGGTLTGNTNVAVGGNDLTFNANSGSIGIISSGTGNVYLSTLNGTASLEGANVTVSSLSGGIDIIGANDVSIQAPANTATLNNQPTGAVALAIATTGYVDTALAATTEVYNELPVVTNGSTDVTLANAPTAGTQMVYLNGIRQAPGAANDYTIASATITFSAALVTGDVVLVDYKY